MAWSVTQGLSATPTQVAISANATTTLSITPTAIGSTLFATIGISGNLSGDVVNIASVSDSVDGAWTLVKVATSSTGGSTTGTCSVVAYRDNASSTTSRTVTVTNGNKAGALTWALGEATHSGITFSLDGSATAGSGNTAGGASVTVSGPTPSQANGLAIGISTNDNGSGWTSPSGGIWSVLWSLTSSSSGTDGRAVIGVGPTSGSAMSTTFTETSGAVAVPSAVVVVFQGPSSGGNTSITPSVGSDTLTGVAPGVTSATATVLIPVTA